MSYLDTPRLHFTGQFQADVSTINNEVAYYDIKSFKPEDQELSTDGSKGGWNPEGTGVFRLIGCRVTGARLGAQQITTAGQDPVIGMALENADDRVFGKLVDLDPQQQAVSQIWGMRLRLTDGKERALFAGEFRPAAFINLWRRQQTGVFLDQRLAAVYQSILDGVEWRGTAYSAVLDALQKAAADGCLSINMNVYGYGRDPTIPRYTIGSVAGTIGPCLAGEPKHFVLGRQMVTATPANPTVPPSGVYSFQCKVHEDRRIVSADFGNCLQIKDASGAFDPATSPPLVLAVLKPDSSDVLTTVAASDVAVLGDVDYLRPGWYAETAGVQDFDYSADPWCVANITARRLLLLTPAAAGNGSYTVLVSETPAAGTRAPTTSSPVSSPAPPRLSTSMPRSTASRSPPLCCSTSIWLRWERLRPILRSARRRTRSRFRASCRPTPTARSCCRSWRDPKVRAIRAATSTARCTASAISPQRSPPRRR